MTDEEKCQACLDISPDGDFDCTNCSLSNERFIPKFSTYDGAYEYYARKGYKSYGWANSGSKHPAVIYRTAYSNWSGSSTLMVNDEFMIMYSVDMGD